MRSRLTDPHATSWRSAAQSDSAPDQAPPDAPRPPYPLPGCMQSGVPLHEALALTGGGNVAHVTLNDQLYVLRITRAGKLILTK